MLDLAQVDMALLQMERSLERERGVVESLASRGQRVLNLAAEAKRYADAAEKAGVFLNKFSDEKQDEIINVIQTIASEGLTQIFDEPIELIISKEIRARRNEMDIKVRTGTLETPIMEARGGGLAAIAGFLLRACVILLTPGARKIMFLDETFAQLSEEYTSRTAEFIRDFCERVGLQVLAITHQPEFAEAASKVYRIERTGPNISKFTEET